MTRANLALLAITCTAIAGCGGGGGVSTTKPPANDPAVTPIHDVQGAGATSPMDGRAITVVGIVTGDYQDNDADTDRNLSGFYIQEPSPDSDPATSEGVFVFDGGSPVVDVSIGDQVAVDGTINEHLGETQLSAAQVTVTGSGDVQATDVNLPADLEPYEGMLIRLPQALWVAGLFELERFGTAHLVAGGRPYAYTNQNAPDVIGYAAHQAEFLAKSILLDGLNPAYPIRSGDTVSGLIGNLRYARASGGSGTEGYRLVTAADPLFEANNPRPATVDVAGSLRVASFNALNFFSTIDAGQSDCGPSGAGGCRGADSTEELERQLAKLVTTLQTIDADIVGLMEIENNAGVALQVIVDRLNAVGSDSYAFVATGTVGNDVITTAFLYRPAAVSLRGPAVILDSRTDMRFDETRSRPSVAQAFTQASNGAVVSIVVNHLKSKGSSCENGGDPNLNDGQGNCNRTRTLAAAALADWISLDPTDSGDADYLVIGDFNAFVFEDPLTTLKAAGLTNLLEAVDGGDFWSSVFAGESGALDHALASATLLPQVAEAKVWHINADEPIALDYNTEFGRDPTLFDPGVPYRSSDHDPIIIGLDLTP